MNGPDIEKRIQLIDHFIFVFLPKLGFPLGSHILNASDKGGSQRLSLKIFPLKRN